MDEPLSAQGRDGRDPRFQDRCHPLRAYYAFHVPWFVSVSVSVTVIVIVGATATIITGGRGEVVFYG